MRVTVERAGKKVEVGVDPARESVTLDGRSYPVMVVSEDALRVELEIGGERVVVENWPRHFPEPPGAVDVNGERWVAAIEAGVSETRPRPAIRAEPAGSATDPGPTNAPTAEGHPILPPMPGRILEVRVREGDRVRKGEVLLVLEAMKMRNEIPSPVDGVVRSLRATPGMNARAREPLLVIAPG